MTIGDVLAVVAGILAICASGWALLIGMTLIFARKATSARDYLQDSPKTSLGVGLVLALTVGIFSFALLNRPNALLKLIGWAGFMALLSLSSLGTGGLALLMNERIRSLEPEMSEFKSLCRGTALLVMAGLVPLLGWFVFTPLVIITSLGTGARVLLQRKKSLSPVTTETVLQPNYAYAPPPTVVAAAPASNIPTLSNGHIATPHLAAPHLTPPMSTMSEGVEVRVP